MFQKMSWILPVTSEVVRIKAHCVSVIQEICRWIQDAHLITISVEQYCKWYVKPDNECVCVCASVHVVVFGLSTNHVSFLR